MDHMDVHMRGVVPLVYSARNVRSITRDILNLKVLDVFHRHMRRCDGETRSMSLTAGVADHLCYQLLWTLVLDSEAVAAITAVCTNSTSPYHLELVWSRSTGKGRLG